MKAIIEEMRFTEGKLVAGVGYYLSPSEAGYDECYRDVLDADGKPTGEKKLYPFLSQSFDIPSTTTKPIFRGVLKDRLDEFKTAHSRLAKIADWVGTEIEVK